MILSIVFAIAMVSAFAHIIMADKIVAIGRKQSKDLEDEAKRMGCGFAILQMFEIVALIALIRIDWRIAAGAWALCLLENGLSVVFRKKESLLKAHVLMARGVNIVYAPMYAYIFWLLGQ